MRDEAEEKTQLAGARENPDRVLDEGIKWSQNSLPKYRREAESAPSWDSRSRERGSVKWRAISIPESVRDMPCRAPDRRD